jgi:acyl-CoA synthetase (AMP-forming)/AMP-acid ligase II
MADMSLTNFTSHDPNAPAFAFPDETISYGRFEEDIAACACWLEERGIKAGTRIGIHLLDHYWNWVAHLAAIRCGAQVVSMLLQDGKNFIKMPRMDVVLASPQPGADNDDVKIQDGERLLTLDLKSRAPLARQLGITPKAAPSREMQSRRLVLTTGTTGKPKVAGWDYAVTSQRVTQLRQSLQMMAATALYVIAPIFTTGGFRYPIAVWQAGGCLICPDRQRDGRLLFPRTPLHNLILTTPASLRDWLHREPGIWAGKDNRHIVVGGGRLPAVVREMALERACARLTMVYGATETGSIATGDSQLIDRHPGAVGFVRPGNQVEIVDDQGHPLPSGQSGFVRIRTPYMTSEYEMGDDPSGGGAFREGWFYPGDEGILYEDGLLAIQGRVSEIINIGGSKLPCAEIEARLDNLPGVTDFCAFVLKLKDADRLGVAVVCETGVNLEDLQKRIQVILPNKMQFSLIRLKQIERNAMGKVSRLALAEDLSARYQQKIAGKQHG